MRAFHEPKTRERARAAVRAIEGETAAEIVVTARARSGSYLHVDLAVGAVLALGTLTLMMFARRAWPYWAFPLDVALAFVVGAYVSSRTSLGRVLSSKKRRRENVRRAAEESFLDHGVHKTSGRWGILVYVSTFERIVEVVGDVAIDPKSLGAEWQRALGAMNDAVAGGDPTRFFVALESLGPLLARAFPRRADDVNELPDDFDVDPADVPAEGA